MARPRKLGHTFNLEIWLRIALHPRRLEDRWKIFKAWLSYLLQNNLDREPTD